MKIAAGIVVAIACLGVMIMIYHKVKVIRRNAICKLTDDERVYGHDKTE